MNENHLTTRGSGASFRVELAYPTPGTNVRPAEVLNGAGWVVGYWPVLRLQLFLGWQEVGEGVVGVDPDQIGHLLHRAHPPGPAGSLRTGFTLSLTVPVVVRANPVLELRFHTQVGFVIYCVPMTLEAADVGQSEGLWLLKRPPPILLRAEAEHAVLEDAGAAGLRRPRLRGWVWRLSAVDQPAPTLRPGPEATEPGGGGRNPILTLEEATATAAGEVTIKGWSAATTGIAEVHAQVAGDVVARARPNLLRADVATLYPHLPNAARSGFRLALHLRRPLARDDVIRLTSVAGDGSVTERAVLPAELDLAPRLDPTGAIRAHLDVPECLDGTAVERPAGPLLIAGWAFSPQGIARIGIEIDGHFQMDAHLGIQRADVVDAYPQCPTLRSGFAATLGQDVLRPGRRDVAVKITDGDGRRHVIRFVVEVTSSGTSEAPCQVRSRVPTGELALRLDQIARLGPAPRFAVLLLAVPGEPPDGESRAATIRSLRAQAYPHWAAALLGAGPAEQERYLDARAEMPRASGRARAAFMQAELIVLLRPGDVLGADALLEFAAAAARNPDADLFFADELCRDPTDRRWRPFYKPGFSAELLLGTNYLGRSWTARRRLLPPDATGIASLARDGDWNVALHLADGARAVVHVPSVLLRSVPCRETGSRQRSAVRNALLRRGGQCTLERGPVPRSFRIRRHVVGAQPRVSIIIPTAGAGGLVRKALVSIVAGTSWCNYELICVSTRPAPSAPRNRGIAAFLRRHAHRVIEYDGAFNWSRINNLAAAAATGTFLLFLNDDVEVHQPDWLERLVSQASRPEVGVVGPRLAYPDGSVQHGGMFVTERGGRHAFRFLPADDAGPFGLASLSRDVSALTGACLMMRRDVFTALGGFDERHAVINNDLDFCLRARQAGLAVIYDPSVTLIHHEKASRADLPEAYDAATFGRAWGARLAIGDPYRNPALGEETDLWVPASEPVRRLMPGGPLLPAGDVRKILAIKVDHLGDFVTALPAMRRLRQHFPRAELVALVARRSACWSGIEPAIDRVITFEQFHARSDRGQRRIAPRALRELQHALVAERFDVALDLRRQPETRHLLRLTGAKVLAGFDNAALHPWLDVSVEFAGDIARQRKGAHIAHELVRLADAVAYRCADAATGITAPIDRDGARRMVEAALGAAGAPEPGARQVVCVHPMAGTAMKQWPADSFARLIQLLVRDGVQVLVIGAGEERRAIEAIIARSGGGREVANLAGMVDLAELPMLLCGIDLFVGNDSGPKHLAAALGVRTVGIQAGNVDVNEWGASGARAINLYRDMSCSPCFLTKPQDCHRGLACISGIRVADVHRCCREMLGLPD